MLKMIIVDDEKIIRETIHSLIDWNSLGIDVAAVCKDGIEAFDCILDEYPDIVMTDIKMPGLSGLDLIEKVRAAQLNTEFIILSGYGEFEFARTAMRYGVKHYLLKPSNETEITQVIVSCVETCKSKTASRVDSLLTQLFLTEMPPEKLLQRRFFTELSGGTGCGSGQDPDDPSGNGGLQEGIFPAQQTADHRQSHGSQRLCHHE